MAAGEELVRSMAMEEDRDNLILARNATRLDFIELAVTRTDRAILVSNAEGEGCYANPAFCDLFGYSVEDFAGQRPWALLAGPLTDHRLHARIGQDDSAGKGFHDDLLLRKRNGEPVWVTAKIDPVFDAQGRFSHLLAMLSDVTETKRLQVFQRDVLEALAHDVPIDELMAAICTKVEALAPDTVCSILRVDEDQRLRPLAGPSLPAALAAALDGQEIGPRRGSCGTAAWRGEPVLTRDIASDPLWDDFRHLVLPLGFQACWSFPMVMRDGRVAGIFAFYFSDEGGPSGWHQELVDACMHLCTMAIERFEAGVKIRRLAYYDGLTGLPNRSLMRQRLEQTLVADCNKRRQIGFLCLDLDRFKDVNDQYGQPMGDALLGVVAQRLLAQSASTDMACRLSGDRFVMIVDECDAEGAARTAQALLASLGEPLEVSGVSIAMTASIGIALYPSDATNVDALIERGETALLDAKSTWRGGYHFFAPAMNASNTDRMMLGAALRQAIAENALSLAYQPQISVDTGALHGLEALARWSHPELGPIPPDRFVRVAEQLGLVEALGGWALGAACRQLASWRADGFAVPGVSVNISARHFYDPQLAELVGTILAENGLAARDLTVEITESAMVDEAPVVAGNIEALAAMGVTLSMDDFGTGYSSLSLIARLPVSELKVDRAFIAQLEHDASAQAIVTAIVCIGQSLGIAVVAEGVETIGQKRFLDALGCHTHQGYLHARPMPAHELEDWMVQRGFASVRAASRSA